MTTFREMRASERDQAKALLALARGCDGVMVKRLDPGRASGFEPAWKVGRHQGTGKVRGDGKRRGEIIAECWSRATHAEILVRQEVPDMRQYLEEDGEY